MNPVLIRSCKTESCYLALLPSTLKMSCEILNCENTATWSICPDNCWTSAVCEKHYEGGGCKIDCECGDTPIGIYGDDNLLLCQECRDGYGYCSCGKLECEDKCEETE